jgi:hypothetical protein
MHFAHVSNTDMKENFYNRNCMYLYGESHVEDQKQTFWILDSKHSLEANLSQITWLGHKERKHSPFSPGVCSPTQMHTSPMTWHWQILPSELSHTTTCQKTKCFYFKYILSYPYSCFEKCLMMLVLSLEECIVSKVATIIADYMHVE